MPTRQPAAICESEAVIANSKPSAPFIPTNKLEALARELFNGALPRLSGDGWKRRCQLAKEFADAHLAVPGVAKPDAAKLAALAPAFRAIAASRQARVDSFIAAQPQPITHQALRDKLVIALGEQALHAKLFNCRHTIACALVMIDQLEGRSAKLDLLTNPIADGGKQFLARLDAAFGVGASAKLLPRGPMQIGALNILLDGLSDAIAESKAVAGFAAPATTATPKPSVTTLSRAASKPAPKAAVQMKLRDFDKLSPRAKMDFIQLGGQLAD